MEAFPRGERCFLVEGRREESRQDDEFYRLAASQ